MRLLSWLVTHRPTVLESSQWDFLLCSMLAWLEVKSLLGFFFVCLLSHKSFVPDVPINKFCKDCQCQEKYVAILFIIIILGCKREREEPLEPVGAAVFV